MKKPIYMFIMFACAALCIVSIVFIVQYYANENSSKSAFSTLSTRVASLEESAEPVSEKNGAGEEGFVNPRVLALRKLAEENGDLVGWIKIEGTLIDYPVMQTPEDPEFYLKRNFEKQSSRNGTPFVGANCDMNDYDNIIIYGHHMKSGAMFAGLMEYEDEEFYKDHSTLQFDTLDAAGEYEIVAVFKSRAYTVDPNVFQYYLFTKAEDQTEFDEFMFKVQENQLYETGVTAEYGDKLITLSTCEYSQNNGRMVVLAKLVDVN